MPFDPVGLRAAFAAAGVDACNVVQEANTIDPIFHVAGYGTEIHEQAEMAIVCWGQWELNNRECGAGDRVLGAVGAQQP